MLFSFPCFAEMSDSLEGERLGIGGTYGDMTLAGAISDI